MLRFVQIAGLISLALLCAQGAWAQGGGADPCQEFLCPDYSEIKNKLNQYIRDSLVNEALDEYKALAACDKCPEHQKELDALNIVIFDILKDKLERAEENARQLEQQKQQLQAQKDRITRESARRQRLLSELEAQRDRNLAITRDALASQYMGLAQRLYESYEENAREKAFWLTDFVFRYIDSEHHMVQAMIHRIYAQQEQGDFEALTEEEEEDFLEEEFEILVSALAWSPDKQWLAAGLADGRLVINNRNGSIDTILTPTSNEEVALYKLDWHPNSNELAVAYSSGSVHSYRLGRQGWSRSDWQLTFIGTINQLKWSPDGTRLAIPTSENNVLIYEKGQTEPALDLSGGHEDWVRAVGWSSDNQFLVSVGDDNRVNYWDLNNQTTIKSHQQHTDWVYAVDWHPSKPLIISGGNDGEILLWNYETDTIVAYSDQYLESVRSLEFSSDGERVLVTRESDTFVVLSADGSSFFQDFEQSPFIVYAADWLNNKTFTIGGDSPQLLTLSINQELAQVSDSIPAPNLNEIATTDVVVADEHLSDAVHELAWSPSGDQLLASTLNGLLILYNDTLSQVLRLAENQINHLAWQPGLSASLPHSNHFAAADDRGQLSLWDANTLQVIQTAQTEETISTIAWSPDGQYLATGTDFGQLTIWQTDQLQAIRTEQIHDQHILQLSWSPDGQYILSGGDDTWVKLWEVATGTVIYLDPVHIDWVRDLLWVDEDRFVTVSDDYRAFLWSYNDAEQAFMVMDTLSDPDMQGYFIATDLVAQDQYLAIGTQGGSVGFWFIEGQRARLDTILQVGGAINALSWHPSRLELVVGNLGLDYPLTIDRYLQYSQQFQLDNFPTIERNLSIEVGGEPTVPLFDQHQKIFGPDYIQWTPDDQLVAVILEDRSAVQVYDVAENSKLYAISDFPEGYLGVAFSRDGQYLACTSIDGAVTVYAAANGQDPTPVLAATNQGRQNRIDWAVGKSYLAIVDDQRNVQVWDQQEQRMVYDRSLEEVYNDVHFSPANPNLLALGSSNSLMLLDLQQKEDALQPVYQGESYVLDARWARNGDALTLLFNDTLPMIHSVQLERRGARANFGTKDFSFWDVSPQGQSLFSYTQENLDRLTIKEKDRNAVQIWDLVTRDQKGVLNPTKNWVVTHLELSPNEQYLATASYEIIDNNVITSASVVHIWDIQKQRSVFELSLPRLAHLSFSPNGQYLVTYLENSSALFWPMKIDQIHRYLLKKNKDAFLIEESNASTGTSYPLAGLINEWNLENDLLLESSNFSRLGEESAAVRLGWAQYYLERARLSPPDDAPPLLDRALSMLKDDEEVELRGDIQLARAKNLLRQQQTAEARRAIRNAYASNPQALHIRTYYTLLEWQEGKKKQAFQLINAIFTAFDTEGEEALRADFLQMQEYGIRFPSENELWRLITMDLPLAAEDYYQSEEPRFDIQPQMEQLTQAYPQEDRAPYLLTYFDRHLDMIYGVSDTAQVIGFLERAVNFLNESYDPATATEQAFDEYFNYQNALITLHLWSGQWAPALLRVDELLAVIDAQNESAGVDEELYHVTLAQKAWILMMKNRSTGEARQWLNRIQTDSTSNPFIHSRYGHLALLENRRKDAYQIYYRVLQDVEFNLDVTDFIYADIGLIDPVELINTRRLFKGMTAIESSEYKLQEIRSEISSTPTNAVDKRLVLYQQKADTTKNLITQARLLINNELLPADTLRGFLEEYAIDQAYVAHYLLLNGQFQEAVQVAQKAMETDPSLNWPLATIANAQLLQGQWQECRKTCNLVLEKEYDCGLVIYDGYRDHILSTAEAFPDHPNTERYLGQLKVLFKSKKN